MRVRNLLFSISMIIFIPLILCGQSLEITTPDSQTVVTGDSLFLSATYFDSLGNPVDTTITWSVIPDSLGNITDNWFNAEKHGQGFIYASLDTLVDSIHVRVKCAQPQMASGFLKIMPADTTVQVGSWIQYAAQLIDTNNAVHDTSTRWSVEGDLLAPITDQGMLFTYFPGDGYVMAKLDTITAKANISVIDSSSDTTGINKISVYRIFPNGKEKKPKIIKEGHKYVIGGLPHPYNVINGGAIYFPVGSLHEDIVLEIKLPKFAKIIKDSIEFVNEIVNGVEFNVFAEDTLSEPYYFDKPVSVALPYKRGILKQYGITPENLTLYFATDSVTFDSLGISQIMVDLHQNRIFGMVQHFSNIVVHEKSGVTTLKPIDVSDVYPSTFVLKQNYPNPFNPVTTIEFILLKDQKITLSIYNSAGQKMQTLISAKLSSGNYKYQWSPQGLASGIYFYELRSGNSTKVHKMLLLK